MTFLGRTFVRILVEPKGGRRGAEPPELERKKRDIHKKTMNIKRNNKNTPFRIEFFHNIIKTPEKET
jgi:hypothetical protein